MQKLRNTYQQDSQITEDQFIQSIVEYDLLVLDEIGLQRGTDAERLAINQIVDQRVCRIKSTGMLTNLSAAEMEKMLGVRIMDRMKMNNGKWIPFNWESYRK
jgi:DNA replication protein DnaC